MTAARIGISEREFWRMLPREFMRRADAFREERKAQAEIERIRHFSRINAAGLAFHGNNWKWIDPNEKSIPDDFEEREKRALARHEERRKRKKPCHSD